MLSYIVGRATSLKLEARQHSSVVNVACAVSLKFIVML